MKITFWGAARQVTGSMFLLELNDGYRILIECGLDMESPKETQPAFPGASFPFEASMLNLVLLTHAHIDHSGKIPNLYREGYEGQVLCTQPTMALTELLLRDVAMLNKARLNKYHKLRNKKSQEHFRHNPADLYHEGHVKHALDMFVPVAAGQRFNVKKGLSVTFLTCSHLLGAASVLVEAVEDGRQKSVLFSGDIGRKGYPLLIDPQPMPQADNLVCETTYGNRRHKLSVEASASELELFIRETCVDKPGRLIIPAFSVGRTQAVLYTLSQMNENGTLPPVKIFADSPMAYRSNRIFEDHRRYLNAEAQDFIRQHGSLFGFDTLHYIESEKQSKQISHYNEPCIIISSSGMIEGGRIQHHVKQNLQNPYCTILMVGYSAEGTFGNQLMNANGSIEVGNKSVPIYARIAQTDTFSGHGDLDDLLEFVGQQAPEKLKNVFLVHGEHSAMTSFRETLMTKGYPNVTVPEKGEVFTL